ncbi:MAG: cytochrome ubiquinol oxidase subunit I [Candidatus Melainabacteria bacterium]|nr:cytochrome ubiquinol oxidase subunit I [Candidatus Melainabacteria bacterium]
MDVVMLSRIQFALTSGFHYIYPPLSIGIGLMLVLFEGIYIKTKNPLYKQITKFWVKIFALTFALGVATGLVQLFGFGTNWAHYSRFVGDVFGSALGAEGIFAFFLEAGFLGIMLFGWDRVSKGMHYFSTICVAAGAHFSAVWIVIANSWMQTPAGHKVVGEGMQARATVTDFWAMIFNPSSVDRLTHVILGCWLAGIFFILSVSAYYYLRKKHLEFANETMKLGLWAAAIVLALQLVSGDSSARTVAEHQPSKLAAMEGVYETKEGTPLTLFGWVDAKEQRVKGVQIPGMLSFLVSRDFKTPVTGLDQIPVDERPPIGVVFQAFHLMIAMWGLMAFFTVAAFYLWKKKKLAKAKWVLWGLIISVIFPQIANQTGWMTAEIGRQPWIVYKILRTPQGVSPTINAHQVMLSILMFIVIYTLLFILFIYLLDKKIKHGPEEDESKEPLYRNIFQQSKAGK